VVRGRGLFVTPAGAEDLALGRVLVLPAALPRWECRPADDLAVLLCSLP